MSVQDGKAADQNDDQKLTEKPEPDKDDKQAAARMMESYKDKPTVILPGSGATVTGTAVNDWLDEEGNPRYQVPDNAGSEYDAKADEARGDEAKQEQIEKDKALNVEITKAAAAENKGEKRSS